MLSNVNARQRDAAGSDVVRNSKVKTTVIQTCNLSCEQLKTSSHERNCTSLWIMINFRGEASSNTLNDQSLNIESRSVTTARNIGKPL